MPKTSFRCQICSKTYSTSSHLRRHEATHTARTASTCPFCNRAFTRVDVARRHVRTCNPDGRDVALPTAKRGKKRRACDGCSKSKLSCDSGSPCGRCRARGVPCTYLLVGTPEPPQSQVNNNITTSAVPKLDSRSDAHPPWIIPVKFLLDFTDPGAATTTEKFTDKPTPEPTDDIIYPSLDAELAAFNLFFDPGSWLIGMSEFQPELLEVPVTCPSEFPGATSKLETRMQHVVAELSRTHETMRHQGSMYQEPFNYALAESVFTAGNARDFIWACFNTIHQHNPVIHRPTFDCEIASTPLLLSVILFGSMYLPQSGPAMSARQFFDHAEEYIFQHSTFRRLFDRLSPEGLSDEEIEILQAAVTMEAVQDSINSKLTRRRIRVERHPRLIAIARSTGLFRVKRKEHVVDWKAFIRSETVIRIGFWTIMNDNFLTGIFNNPPLVAISEVQGHLPCHEDLFDAETAEDFWRFMTSLPRRVEPPSLSKFVSLLLQDTWSGPRDDMYSGVTASHLLAVSLALLSMTVTSRNSCLRDSVFDTITRATDRWKVLWDFVFERDRLDQSRRLGFAKHAPETLWLVRTIIRATKSGDDSSGFMQNVSTYSLKDVNDFVRRYKET